MASRERINVVGYAGVFYVETTRSNGKGTEKIYYIRYRKDGKQIEEKAGGQYRDNMTVQKAANLHGLRHVFASCLASSGDVSMYELQKLLTHASPQMTQHYAHLHDGALKKASGVASNLFGAVSADKVAATGK